MKRTSHVFIKVCDVDEISLQPKGVLRQASVYINDQFILRGEVKAIKKLAHGVNLAVKQAGFTPRLDLP